MRKHCSNPDCQNIEAPIRSRGLCKKCYMRLWRNGSIVDPYAHLRASRHATARDIEWCAGFLEGEGSFMLNSPKVRCAKAHAVQVNKEPLIRLRDTFGGSLYYRKQSRNINGQPYWEWNVSGPRARGIMLTIYGLMSEKRKAQIRVALSGQPFKGKWARERARHFELAGLPVQGGQ